MSVKSAYYCCGAGLAGGAEGVAGLVSGEVEPEPVVAGGVTLRTGPLLPVVIGADEVFAAFSVELLFQPAKTTKAIRATTAMPAECPADWWQHPAQPAVRS